MPKKLCEKCQEARAISKQRYCKECKKAVIALMEDSGYLTPKQYGHVGQGRTSEMRENTRETKHGNWHG